MDLLGIFLLHGWAAKELRWMIGVTVNFRYYSFQNVKFCISFLPGTCISIISRVQTDEAKMLVNEEF